MPRPLRKPPPRYVIKQPGQIKALRPSNTLVRSIRKITAKKAPSKNIVSKFKRAVDATKKASTVKPQKEDPASVQARIKALKSIMSRKNVIKNPTNITVKAKQNSIKNIAQIKAIQAVNRFKENAAKEKIKNSVKIQQNLRNLQTARDERTLPTKRLEISENGTTAAIKYNSAISKLKIAISNSRTAGEDINVPFNRLNGLNKNSKNLRTLLGNQDSLNTSANSAGNRAKLRAALAKAAAKKAGENADDTDVQIKDLDKSPLSDKDVPPNPTRDAAIEAGHRGNDSLRDLTNNKNDADDTGIDALRTGINKKIASDDIDSYSSALRKNDSGAAELNNRNASSINTNRIDTIKNNKGDVPEYGKGRNNAGASKNEYKDKMDAAQRERIKSEEELNNNKDSISKTEAELRDANRKNNAANADYENTVNDKTNNRNKLNDLNSQEPALRKAKNDAYDKAEGKRPRNPEEVNPQIDAYKKGINDANKRIDENNKNIEGEQSKLKPKPDDPTAEIEAKNRELERKNQEEIDKRKQLEKDSEDVDAGQKNAQGNRNRFATIQMIVGMLIANLVGNYISRYLPRIPPPWGGPGPDPNVPGNPTGPTTPHAKIYESTPTASKATASTPGSSGIIQIPGPSGITDISGATSNEDIRLYNIGYASGLAAGRADGQIDATNEAYSRLNKIPTASQKGLLAKIRTIESTDIDEDAIDLKKKVYCDEIIAQSLKENLDVATNFPGCTIYLPTIHESGPSGPYYSGPSGPYYSGPSGPYYSGPSGPYYSGPSGPDESGPDESGPDEPGPNEPGPNEPGPNEPGPNEPGPNEPGPNEPGPNEPGPNELVHKAEEEVAHKAQEVEEEAPEAEAEEELENAPYAEEELENAPEAEEDVDTSYAVGGYREENGIMMYPEVQHGGVIDPSYPSDSGYNDGYILGYTQAYTLYLTLVKMTLKIRGINIIDPTDDVFEQDVQDESGAGESGAGESGAGESGSNDPDQSGGGQSKESGRMLKAAKKGI